MAPEQARPAPPTISADLYSLGCTLYYLLAGRPPFGGGKHPSVASKLMAHRLEPPEQLGPLRPELARYPELLALLDRLLAEDPADRPSEPLAVAEALAPSAAGHGLRVCPAPRPPSPAMSPRRLGLPPLGGRTFGARPASPAQSPHRRPENQEMPNIPQDRPKPSYLLAKVIGGLFATVVAPFCVAIGAGYFSKFLSDKSGKGPDTPLTCPKETPDTPPHDVSAVVPKPIQLFNHKDLNNSQTSLGGKEGGEAYGVDNDPLKVFSITADGDLRVSGEVFGALETKQDFGDYVLTVEYRVGEKIWPQAKGRGE